MSLAVTIFLRFLKPFFTTSFYGFGTWPKWPLQPLHFSVFGAAVARYFGVTSSGNCGNFYLVIWTYKMHCERLSALWPLERCRVTRAHVDTEQWCGRDCDHTNMILAVTRASHGAFPYESSLPVINLSKLGKSWIHVWAENGSIFKVDANKKFKKAVHSRQWTTRQSSLNQPSCVWLLW